MRGKKISRRDFIAGAGAVLSAAITTGTSAISCMDGACMGTRCGNSPRPVLRGVNSQKVTPVGVHWLRISFNYKDLSEVRDWVSYFFGESDRIDRGLWGFDCSFRWPCGASLFFDSDRERSLNLHDGRITFEAQGKPCDELTAADLTLLMDGCAELDGICKRIDVFLDDLDRIVEPNELHDVIDRGDYSRFRKAHKYQVFESGDLVRDEVWFGRRGGSGSGKYLRVYDKAMESNGENPAVRWEVEFTEDKAHDVFTKLSGTGGNLETFALLCACLVFGCITFVHRTGEKNIDRLDVYEFWNLLKNNIGELRIRTEKKYNTLTGVFEWTEKQVSPSLACIYSSFRSEKEFFTWLIDTIDNGSARWNANQRQIVDKYSGSITYDPKCDPHELENRYVSAMCNVH